MATIPFALALVLAISAQEDRKERDDNDDAALVVDTWDDLAEEYERAQVAWIQAMSIGGGWQKPPDEQPPGPRSVLWPRFEALSALGEPRATVWLIQNLSDGTEERTECAAILFERVRRAGDAGWVAKALPALVDEQDALPAGALAPYLAELLRTAAGRDLRIAALLASAAIEPDRELADDLRLRAASLRWKGVEPRAGERLEDDRLAEIAAALLDGLPVEERNWFETNFIELDENSITARAESSPDPKDTWRPVLDTLAARGGVRACAWSLSNTWPESEADVNRMREQVDALSRARVADDVLRDLSWRVGLWVQKLGPEFVEPRVRALAEHAGDEAHAALLLGLGDGLCKEAADDAAREHGLAVLREVQARWPDSDEGKRARGKIFRHTNLVVGKPVPDFEALDVDGNALKLSDSRGKVTVLVFWGFW